MPTFNFVGSSYNGRSASFDAQRSINLYLEVSESKTSRSPAMLVGTPGLLLWATTVVPPPPPPPFALDLNFAASDVLDSRVTFTRASSATRFNSAGTLVTMTNDQPRFDYNPSTLAARGLLIEESRTNIALYSNDFTNAVWTKQAGVTVTANSTTSPDGTTNASLIDLTAAAVGTGIYQTIGVTNAVTYAETVWLKGVLGTEVLTVDDPGGSLGLTGTLNLTTSWQRFIIIKTAIASGNGGFWLKKNTGNQFYMYGEQFEAGASAKSYIATIAASVPRAADVAKFTPPASVSSIRYTFDDDTTQDASVTPSVEYTIPTTLNRERIKRIVGL